MRPQSDRVQIQPSTGTGFALLDRTARRSAAAERAFWPIPAGWMSEFGDRVNRSRSEEKLQALGLALPAHLAMPSPDRRPCFLAGSTLCLSGYGFALLVDAVGPSRFGKLPPEVSLESATMVAEAVAQKMLATTRAAMGSLDPVEQGLTVTEFINSDPGFEAPNSVLNGTSDLFYRIYGQDAGRHCRSAIGAGALVARQNVEIEGIVLIGSSETV